MKGTAKLGKLSEFSNLIGPSWCNQEFAMRNATLEEQITMIILNMIW